MKKVALYYIKLLESVPIHILGAIGSFLMALACLLFPDKSVGTALYSRSFTLWIAGVFLAAAILMSALTKVSLIYQPAVFALCNIPMIGWGVMQFYVIALDIPVQPGYQAVVMSLGVYVLLQKLIIMEAENLGLKEILEDQND